MWGMMGRKLSADSYVGCAPVLSALAFSQARKAERTWAKALCVFANSRNVSQL